MKIRLVSVNQKPPGWVKEAFEFYLKRLPRHIQFSHIEIPLAPRHKGLPIDKVRAQEGQKILSAVPNGLCIALDERGSALTTVQLSEKLHVWMPQNPLNFIIGGPDGLSKTCQQHAQFLWSLSKLTLPHTLAKIVFIEQLYRAFSLLSNHPYHRP